MNGDRWTWADAITGVLLVVALFVVFWALWVAAG